MSKSSQQAAIRSQISAAQSKKEEYLKKAREVKKIYEELRTIKGEFVKQKKSLNTPAEDLIENFDSSIKAMNENIDKLLNKINEYENKAMEQDGFIGQLGILLNNISGWFESFVN